MNAKNRTDRLCADFKRNCLREALLYNPSHDSAWPWRWKANTKLGQNRVSLKCMYVWGVNSTVAKHSDSWFERHRKITRAFIWRLTEHNMSYKTLYDIKYFLTLSALVMMFKAYLTYICFLSVILCFLKNMFFKQHIFLSVILCFLKNILFF